MRPGSLVCGVVFGLMGGLPLLWGIPHLWKVYALGDMGAAQPLHVTATGNAVMALKRVSRLSAQKSMTQSLGELNEMHESGALSDFEYAQAKDRVIRGQDS